MLNFQIKKSFPAQLSQLHEMIIFIREELKKFDEVRGIKKIELACEEALVNIMRHGYLEKEGVITIEVIKTPEFVKIAFIDNAPHFNPLESQSSVDIESDLTYRKLGGLGIYFMQKCVDDIFYERENNLNKLTLIKKL